MLSKPTEETAHEARSRDRDQLHVEEGDAADRFRPVIDKFLRRWQEEEAQAGEVERFLRRELNQSNINKALKRSLQQTAKETKCDPMSLCRKCNEEECRKEISMQDVKRATSK